MAIGNLPGFSERMPRTLPVAAPLPVQLALGLRSLVLVDEDADMRRRFAYALNAAMLVKSWKAPDLAKAIHRDASTVTRWAKGESIPSLFLVKPISEALGVRPALLFDPPPVPDYPLSEYLSRSWLQRGSKKERRQFVDADPLEVAERVCGGTRYAAAVSGEDRVDGHGAEPPLADAGGSGRAAKDGAWP